MPDTALHPLRMALEKFWAPVPWMLEAAVGLELIMGKYVEAAIIAALLVFNAALGFFQESQAQATLAALKSRLALNASVRRDNAWKTVTAAELVQGDVVKLSLGAVVPADVHITGGEVLLDQSMLTGESVPIEAGAGAQTYAGALVRQATTYNNRERRRLWSSRPSCWVVVSSVADVLIASTFSVAGIAVKPLPIRTVLGTLAATIAFAVILDFVKVPAFRRLEIN